MIPEKWDKLYLYSCVIDMPQNVKTGELFFYYIPKGVLKKKPVNVYEIPNKFNLDENQYLKLVELLFNKIKQLREEFRKVDTEAWSNITLIIENSRVRVEYDYGDLKKSNFTSYERHIIWRFIHLKTGLNTYNKKERKIINTYLEKCKYSGKVIDRYVEGIYRNRVHNVINYNKEEKQVDELKYVETKPKKEKQKIEGKQTVNQILRY